MNSIVEEQQQQQKDRSPNVVKVLNFKEFSNSPSQSERNLYLLVFRATLKPVFPRKPVVTS